MPHIEHAATIIAINKEYITAELLSHSACTGCSLKENCSMSENKVRKFQIPKPQDFQYQIGQNITIEISSSSGWIALFWAYILPLILVLSALLTTIFLTRDETIAALSSLSILLPYYSILWLFRQKFAKKINFKIKT